MGRGNAGVAVHADLGAGPLPAAADTVLAPVLREAVTNILRHSAATSCTIEVTATGGALRLRVGNDGAPPDGHVDRTADGGAAVRFAAASARG